MPSGGQVRWRDKLETVYLHFDEAYGYKTWQNGDE